MILVIDHATVADIALLRALGIGQPAAPDFDEASLQAFASLACAQPLDEPVASVIWHDHGEDDDGA